MTIDRLLPLSLPLVALTLLSAPQLQASLTSYDGAIAADQRGSFPSAATLTEPIEFDTTFGEEFDFGDVTEDATFEFIVEGNSDIERNGFLGVGSNSGNSLRYEQWDDTGVLGFTRSGLTDYVFIAEDDEDLLLSPAEPTHIAYVWSNDEQLMELYVNGTLGGIVEGATFEMPTGLGFLGAANAAGEQGMEGTIHRVTTYDRVLPPAAIMAHSDAWLAVESDPSIWVSRVVELPLGGTVQEFSLAVVNGGDDNMLNISNVTVGGDDADKFSVTTEVPIAIPPGGETMIAYTFDPGGDNGATSAFLIIESDDPTRDEVMVQLSGLIQDPKLESPAAIVFGDAAGTVTLPLTITNAGGSRPLVISGIALTGPEASAFSATNPGTIAVGESAQSMVTFTPGNKMGANEAILVITSDDPLVPMTSIALSAFVPFASDLFSAYDAVISADHGDGNGQYPYEAILLDSAEFDGTEAAEFDFGDITDSATFEFIVEGDPVDGGRDGFLAVGEDPADNFRYEQWDDTGELGFTRLGVADNRFDPVDDPDLLLSPEEPTHITFKWDADDFLMELFVNGVLAGTNEGPDFAMPAGIGWIGAKNNDGAEGMLGIIHRVVTYNDLLPEDVILAHALGFTEGIGPSTAGFSIIALAENVPAKSVVITWTSSEGSTYFIERSNNLMTWEELEDGLPATGEETSFTDTLLTGDETELYYRVNRSQ